MIEDENIILPKTKDGEIEYIKLILETIIDNNNYKTGKREIIQLYRQIHFWQITRDLELY